MAFAIVLELSLDETKDLLMKAGYAFSNSSKSDVIISFLTKKALKFKRILINTVFKGINKENIKEFTTILQQLKKPYITTYNRKYKVKGK